MMNTTTSKSTLAKLLASENIRIEHKNVVTASFNVQDRVLTLPMWKQMSDDLYDMLIGHEVGHALFTPPDSWSKTAKHEGRLFQEYMNIVEDARIERLMKDKYPGLRRNFFVAYQELHAQDVFGIGRRTPQTFPLIDRLNMYFKIGAYLHLTWTPDEQVFVDRLESTQTFDDVLSVTRDLLAFAKAQEQQMRESWHEVGGLDDDADYERLEFDLDERLDSQPTARSLAEQESDASDEDADGDETENTSNADETGDEDEDETERGMPYAMSAGSSDEDTDEDDNDDMLSPQTMEKLHEHMLSLLDPASLPNHYAVLNDRMRYRDFVMPMKSFHEHVLSQTQFRSVTTYEVMENETLMDRLYLAFQQKHTTSLNHMTQEFELRRKAWVSMHAKTSKTGRLDPSRLYAYSMTDNIFAQKTLLPDGKNHGMLLLMDLSGSMASNMRGTMEQLALLTSFCQKVKIPFEVYGFTDGIIDVNYRNALAFRNQTQASNEMAITNADFRLVHMMSSRASSAEMKRALKMLLLIGASYEPLTDMGVECYSFLRLNGTPLLEALMVLRFLADDFRQQYRLEVLNTVLLTDGESNAGLVVGLRHEQKSLVLPQHNLVMEDARTHQSVLNTESALNYYTMTPVLTQMLTLYRQTTGSRLQNFYLLEGKATLFRRRAQEVLRWDEVQMNDAMKTMKKSRMIQASNHGGYDMRFLLPGGKNLEVLDESLSTVTTTTKRQLVKAFTDIQQRKQTNRVLLTQMAASFA